MSSMSSLRLLRSRLPAPRARFFGLTLIQFMLILVVAGIALSAAVRAYLNYRG